jgi:hypothetical protein
MVRVELGLVIVGCWIVAGCSDAGGSASAIHLELSDAGAVATRERCVAPDDVDSSPSDIAQAVELINALPKPLSLPCFLETLARPLSIDASRSLFSNQPAQGARSPRIFLFNESLVMAVVPLGMGTRLLEFGEESPDKTSVKAEIEFPIEGELGIDDPFKRVLYDDTRTSCGFCHRSEEPAPEASSTFAFRSQALRPEQREAVAIESLRAERDSCNPDAEPDRCAMLDALFYGEVVEHDFDAELDTFL